MASTRATTDIRGPSELPVRARTRANAAGSPPQPPPGSTTSSHFLGGDLGLLGYSPVLGRAASGAASGSDGTGAGSAVPNPAPFGFPLSDRAQLDGVGGPDGAEDDPSKPPGLHTGECPVGPKEKAKRGRCLQVLRHSVSAGSAGGLAMMLQVLLLMWLKTTISYQAVHQVSASEAFTALYDEGGIVRFYSGFWLALMTAVLARFGDTASNGGMMRYTVDMGLPTGIRTLLASAVAALWRVIILPLDTAKTMMAVGGPGSLGSLQLRIQDDGLGTLWTGAMWVAIAAIGGHFPWFVTFNYLSEKIPESRSRCNKNMRRALIGFCSAVVATLCTNPFHNYKVQSQFAGTSDFGSSSVTAGFQLRIFTALLSSILFTVMWQEIQELISSPRCSRFPGGPHASVA